MEEVTVKEDYIQLGKMLTMSLFGINLSVFQQEENNAQE